MSEQETNLKEYEEECRGCKGCGPSSITCPLKPHFIDNQGNKIICPCSTCLIKMICVSSCDKIQEYIALIMP